jgi:hypothetical protein
MATTPWSQLVDKELSMHYHLVSSCVRKAYLCGDDKHSRNKYDHRKGWLEERLFHDYPQDLDAQQEAQREEMLNNPFMLKKKRQIQG